MSYFDDASLVMIPSGYKTSKVYSVKPTDGSGDLTFSRSNDTATRVNSAGLIEKVRTNLLTYSNTFSNAAWSKVAQGTGSVAVVTPNYTTDPFGGNNAWRFQCNLNGGTTASDRSWMLQSFTPIADNILSIYIKLNVAGSKTIVFSNSGGNVQTITSTDWVRINIATSASSGEFRIGLVGGYSSDTLDCSIAFAQVETGDIATDYIATTTAAVSVGPVANVPRLDYLNSSCPRLLLEPQRTNLATYSEQFNNAAWVLDGDGAGQSVTANYAISPDGYQNADRIQLNKTGGSYSRIRQSFTAAYSGATTFSVYLKTNDATTKTAYLRIDGGTSTLITITGNWTRFSITNNWIYSLGYSAELFLDTGSSNTADISAYGAQVEAGAYATSYIPTLGAAVTRGADACSKTGISSLIGSTAGTIFLDATFNTGSSNADVFQLDGAGTGTFVLFLAAASGNINLYLNTTTTVRTIKTGNNRGQRHKIAISYQSGSLIAYVDGVQTLSTTYTIEPDLADLYVNTNDVGSNKENTILSQLILFKSVLSPADLAALTTI